VLKNHIVELSIYTINVLRSYNIDPAKLIGDSSAMFYRIINFQDMHALHFWMRDFLSASIEALENKNLRYSPCIARVVAHIEKNFAEDISLKTIAYDLNINAAYLGQLFKSETGQLFSAYLNKIRIENAQYLLLNTTLTLAEVSQQCGYTNISYFYNIFRKITGKTPSQYRKTRTK
jgi:two-component system response regulator YesN